MKKLIDFFCILQNESGESAASTASSELPQLESKKKKRNKKDPNAGLVIPSKQPPPAVSPAVGRSKLKAFLAQSDDMPSATGSSKLQHFLKQL
jgi:hypothetical protein